MRHLKTVLAVFGAAAILILAGNAITMAATGQPFLLGKTNTANAVTTVQRTNAGPAFKITNDTAASAPFVTNGTGKVTNLNADKVDGVDSSTMKTTAYAYKTSINNAIGSVSIDIPVPSGSYAIDYSAYLSGADNGSVACYLEQDPIAVGQLSTFVGESRFVAGAITPGLTGSGLLTKSPTSSLELHCIAANSWTTNTNQPIQIVATRIDTLLSDTIVLPKKSINTAERKQ